MREFWIWFKEPSIQTRERRGGGRWLACSARFQFGFLPLSGRAILLCPEDLKTMTIGVDTPFSPWEPTFYTYDLTKEVYGQLRDALRKVLPRRTSQAVRPHLTEGEPSAPANAGWRPAARLHPSARRGRAWSLAVMRFSHFHSRCRWWIAGRVFVRDEGALRGISARIDPESLSLEPGFNTYVLRAVTFRMAPRPGSFGWVTAVLPLLACAPTT